MSDHTQQDRRALHILAELAAHPAAPFHESLPAGYIVSLLSKLNGIDFHTDDFGNIIAHYASPHSLSQQHPPIAFVAHMDHPGYEIFRQDGQRFTARALGGVPAASIAKPTPAMALLPDGQHIPAEILPLPPDEQHVDGERLVSVRLKTDTPPHLTLPTAVVFDLPDFAIDGDTILMRSADDLAGCASILSALERLVEQAADADFYAVFTRAEEGGLFGARLMAEAGTLPKDTLVVSVESSPIIPGVVQGGGVVIRTGDRVYTFDADAEQALIVAQDAIASRDKDFKCQRQLMSGGGCEATAFAVFGYSVTGLAFPLGNWHNATTSIQDPDGGVDSEYISVSDYLNGVALITEAAVSVAERNNSAVQQRIREIPDEVRRRMTATASDYGSLRSHSSSIQ